MTRPDARLALGLACLLPLLVHCGKDSDAPVAPAQAAPAAVATSTAAATASTPANDLVLHFSTDEPTIGSQVGERRLGSGMHTSGRAGWLMFGPYAALPAGNYRAELQGFAEPANAGVVYVDIARDKGATVVAALELDAAQLANAGSGEGWIVLPFSLPSPASDIEVRVRVGETAQLAVAGYAIRAVR